MSSLAADRAAFRTSGHPRLEVSPGCAPVTERASAHAVRPLIRETGLLLGNYRPALSVARSLSSHGYRVLMGLGGGEGCTEYSRFVDETWTHPDVAAPGDAFLVALLSLIAARPDITVIYPVAEEFVRFLAEHEPALRARIVVASPAPGVVRTCCDKLAMLRMVERMGVHHLPYRAVNTLQELPAAARELGYPLVIRPLHGVTRLGHKKALIVDDEEHLYRLLPRLPDGRLSLLLQRHAHGERQDVFFAALQGRILRAMQVRYLRTDHIDGTGLCVYGEIQALDHTLLRHCRALTQALDYTGIGCAQFVVDVASHNNCFLEINPRTSAIHRVPEAMGMNLSSLAIALARGELPPELGGEFCYRPGRRFAWTYGDLRGIKSALRNREIGLSRAVRWLLQVLWAAVRVHMHLTWRRDDPLPTIMLFIQQLGFARQIRARPERHDPAPEDRDQNVDGHAAHTWFNVISAGRERRPSLAQTMATGRAVERVAKEPLQ